MAEAETIRVVVAIKQDERFVIIYPVNKQGDALRQVSKWAQAKDINFSWVDAGHMAAQIRFGTSQIIDGEIAGAEADPFFPELPKPKDHSR